MTESAVSSPLSIVELRRLINGAGFLKDNFEGFCRVEKFCTNLLPEGKFSLLFVRPPAPKELAHWIVNEYNHRIQAGEVFEVGEHLCGPERVGHHGE